MNKKMFFAFVVILLVGAGTFVTAGIFSANSLNKGLVGHWTLDKKDYNSNTNRVTDKSAYSNHGTNVGATFTTDRMGHSEGAMSFDGSNDYITVPDTSSLDDALGSTETYAISMWIKPSSWVSYGAVSKAPGGCWSHSTNSLWVYSGGFRCVMGDGNTAHCNSAGSYIGTGAYKPSLDKWYNVVCSSDGVTLRMYVNGIQRGTASVSSITETRLDNNNPLIIGRRTSSSGGAFSGPVEEVRVYDRALSSNEIKLLYNSYKPAGGASAGNLKKGLILDMPLKSRYTKSETAGSEMLTDRTPYSNDGQNHGATLSNSGASFDGGDSVSLGDSLDPDSNSWTTCVWVNWDGDATTENIIYNKENLYELRVNNGYVQYAWQPHWAWDGGTTCPISANEWKYVCVKYDHSKQYLYCNGDLKYSRSQTGNIGTNSNPFCIGARGSSCSNNRFHGNITNVKIYNRALSEDEIELLYARGRY